MPTGKNLLLLSMLAATCGAPVAMAGLAAGRGFAEDDLRPLSLKGGLGLMKFDKGTIDETARAWDGTPQDEYQAYLSNYTLDELGFTDNYYTFNVNLEQQWQFFTLQLDAMYSQPSASAVARMHDTASPVPDHKKGYYIGVDDVEYNGNKYEYMFIPNGTRFSSDLQAGSLEIKGLITPVSFVTEQGFKFTPWIFVGVLGLIGNYTIDAGPARGTVQYEIPPETYVVGGKGTGTTGGALPEVGVGGELRIKLGEMATGDAFLSVQGNVGYLQWDGRTGDFGIQSRREKDIDLKYLHYELAAQLELPISYEYELALILGVRARKTTANADATASDRSAESQDNLNEKYDKHIELEMTQLQAYAGLLF